MSKTYPEPNEVEFFEQYKRLCKKYDAMITFNDNSGRFVFTEYNKEELEMIESELYDKS